MSNELSTPPTPTECFDILGGEFPQVDAAVVFGVLQQCLEGNAATAIQHAREILQEIAIPPDDNPSPQPVQTVEDACLPLNAPPPEVDAQRLPSPLRMRVNDASKRYPLLDHDAIIQICKAYAERHAESVLREAHQQLVSERTQVGRGCLFLYRTTRDGTHMM